MSKAFGWLYILAAFVIPLSLYLRTLAPTYIPIDSAEFALCMHFWGVCHPPGFALYTLLGKIFTDLWPFGTLIYKANLMSAIFGSLTVLLVFLTLRILKVDKILALLLALFLAVSQIFWEFSLSADVFTFATFLLALSVFLAFKKRIFLAFFVLGLSASHFYISAVLWPIMALYFMSIHQNGVEARKGFNPYWAARMFSISLFIFALGFFPQALMYWRMQQGPEINWGHAQGISGFVDFVRRKEFGSIFLIANPVLTFSLFKLFKHFWVYFVNLLLQFGIVLPIFGVLGITFGGLYKDRKLRFLIFSFLAVVCVQLTLLSTIDPLEKGSPFQLTKFYLSSFVLAIFVFGMGVENLAKRFFGEKAIHARILIFFFVVIYFFANFKTNDYSNNHFSQNLVLDALSQLPDDSIAITVSHVFYFGSLYEQKIGGKFENIDLLYFPNEKNRDGEKYQPGLFEKGIDSEFVNKVSKGKSLGRAETYILDVISRNLDMPIFILQGTFEEKFFGYLKPYVRPYGLWWRVEKGVFDQGFEKDQTLALFENLQGAGLNVSDLHLKQQRDDLLTYAVSYNSAGVQLASRGYYDEALIMFEKSLTVNLDSQNVKDEIELVGKTQKLDLRIEQLMAEGNKDSLSTLGNNLFILGNFRRCGEVFEKTVQIWQNDAQLFNNIASCYAQNGQGDLARANYQRALEVDPNLEKAKIGLEELENFQF